MESKVNPDRLLGGFSLDTLREHTSFYGKCKVLRCNYLSCPYFAYKVTSLIESTGIILMR